MARRLLGALLCLALSSAGAAPRLPADEGEVLERLPVRPGDPVAAELRTLRAAAAADPADSAAAGALGRRYFALAMAQGDPRYIGYAEAALRPWQGAAQAPAEVLVLRAMLRQYRHDFDGALDDLARALGSEPGNSDAHAWRAAIFMVRAEYAAAARECGAIADEVQGASCSAYVEATTGNARQAYSRLLGALQRAPAAHSGQRLWILTRLAEIAWRLGENDAAERHFREALALDLTDNFVLAAYADFLLAQRRNREVVALLGGWARSDTLLLRLALAEREQGLPSAAARAQALGERFAEAAARGERLHLAEEARYLLELRGDAKSAVAAAAENWKSQREPRDALVLLEAAHAARDPLAAAPALAWLERTRFEHPRMRQLAAALR